MTTTPQFVPRRASTIAMWLFLAALAMLFAASMMGYVIIRITHPQVRLNTVHLPRALWASTLMMLAASYTMHRALLAIRREKQALFRTYLNVTLLLAAVFVCVQTPAMVDLLHDQKTVTAEYDAETEVLPPPVSVEPNNPDEVIASRRSVPYYALVMVLILIHAMHVIGGMISLVLVAYNGHRGRYDHEHYTGVSNCVLYWHFLDGVWLIMFTVIMAFG